MKKIVFIILLASLSVNGQKKKPKPARAVEADTTYSKIDKELKNDKTIGSVRLITFKEFIQLLQLNNSELNSELYILGWKYIRTIENVKESTTSIVYNNNGKNNEDAQVLIQYVNGDVQFGINVLALELIVSDFNYIKLLISDLKNQGFTLISKNDLISKFQSTNYFLTIEKYTIKEKTIYKIQCRFK